MRYKLTEFDRDGVEKRSSFHNTRDEAKQAAEGGYGSWVGSNKPWRRLGDDDWEIDEPLTGGTWRIEPAP